MKARLWLPQVVGIRQVGKISLMGVCWWWIGWGRKKSWRRFNLKNLFNYQYFLISFA
jgi:hypothetical protein